MKTGQDTVRAGSYVSDCCLAEVELLKREMFPRCPKCLKLTSWETIDTGTASTDKKAA
jgi:hypothetical protein